MGSHTMAKNTEETPRPDQSTASETMQQPEGPQLGIDSQQTGAERSFDSIDVDATFFERLPDGSIQFNVWSLLAPAQLDVSWKKLGLERAMITVPYEYARAFDTAEPVRPEDHAKAEAYLKQQLEQQLFEVLYGFDVSKNVYRMDHAPETPANMLIHEMKFGGSASPEAEKYGPASIQPGSIENENVRLAELRAQFGKDVTIEQLRSAGISPEILDAALQSVRGEEAQFSDAEMQDLAALASGEQGADELEQIMNLIMKYNHGELTDPVIKAQLDTIVGSKRNVSVTVDFEGGQKKTLLIPLPLTLLIPLLLVGIRRPNIKQVGKDIRDALLQGGRYYVGPTTRSTNQQTTSPTIKSSEATGGETLTTTVPEVSQGYLESISRIEVPASETVEFQEMQERSVVDDLYVFFDRPETMQKGLNYRSIVDTVRERFDSFSDSMQRELFATALILEAWKEHDAAARRSAGWSEDSIHRGLDYENQPKQVQWARIHAHELCSLAEAARKLDPAQKEIDYVSLLAPTVRRLTQRRVLRGAGR
jgi:hypothetical protein